MRMSIRKRLGTVRRLVEPQLRWQVDDIVTNWRWARDPQRILILRHAHRNPDAYCVFLNWLAEDHPQIRRHFEVCTLPLFNPRWANYRLCVPWLNDPVQDWSPWGYEQILRIQTKCQDNDIPVINPVDRLLNASKLEGPKRMAAAGLRVPKAQAISDQEQFKDSFCGFEFPFIVREGRGHGGRMLKIDNADEARSIDLTQFRSPIVSEFVDVKDANDGIYRKYRFVVIGDVGISLSIHFQNKWITRGSNALGTPELIASEENFVTTANPHAEQFLQARKNLELDFVAFDYAYDHCGEMVVWEANPFPVLHLARQPHRRKAYVRVLSAMAQMYLKRAGLPSSDEIDQTIADHHINTEISLNTSPA